MGGTYLVSASKSFRAINFFTSSMAIAWSIVPLVQASSQRLLQTFPQTAGNGFSFLINANASVYLPCAAILRYPCTAMWAGQAVLQGAVPVS